MHIARWNKIFRNIGPDNRTHFAKVLAAWLVGTLISFPSPGTSSPSASFFITSYETALNLLENSSQLGRPLLESAYDSLHLYETCAQTELSGQDRASAADLLNKKLSSLKFARAYERYKKSGQRLFTRKEAKDACAALAQNAGS